jgi:hypothetical protein
MRPFFQPLVFLLAGILTCTCHLSAQNLLSDKRALSAIPVSQEPRHHKVFENIWVRILDVHIPPGDTSLFHRHETPSVFIVLSNTKTGSEVVIEPGKPQFTNGNIWFEGFYDTVRIHRVWNSDTTEFHVMDIELPNRMNAETGPSRDPLGASSVSLLFDEKPVRGYRLTYSPKTASRMNESRGPVLVVRLGEGSGGPGTNFTLNGKSLTRKGDYLFIPGQTRMEISNPEDSAVALAYFELK